METGIRELRDNLSRYIRRMDEGERIVVTAHGRVVAEPRRRSSPFDQLVASGVIASPIEMAIPWKTALRFAFRRARHQHSSIAIVA